MGFSDLFGCELKILGDKVYPPFLLRRFLKKVVLIILNEKKEKN